MGYELVGKVWDVAAFRQYLKRLDLSWADGITLHHTAAPSLAQRPQGFKIQHMRNLRDYYEHELGWTSGPHLFVDEDQIFGMSSLSRRGVHARSFNAKFIGIEVLGDYDNERPDVGRGLACWRNAAAATAALGERINGAEVNFHRDDPRTSKTCPGKLVEMDWFMSLVTEQVKPKDDRDDDGADFDRTEVSQRFEAVDWQIKKLKELILEG